MVVLSAVVVQMGSSLLELFLKTVRITQLCLTLLEKKKLTAWHILDTESAKETRGHGGHTGGCFVLSSVFQFNI